MKLTRHRRSDGGVGFIILAVFSLIGLAVAAFMMYVGWKHNPQGAFHDETGVYWGYWLLLGFSWFIAIAGIPYAIGVVVLVWRAIARSRRAKPTRTI
jgi:uncharacterized membrane protein